MIVTNFPWKSNDSFIYRKMGIVINTTRNCSGKRFPLISHIFRFLRVALSTTTASPWWFDVCVEAFAAENKLTWNECQSQHECSGGFYTLKHHTLTTHHSSYVFDGACTSDDNIIHTNTPSAHAFMFVFIERLQWNSHWTGRRRDSGERTQLIIIITFLMMICVRLLSDEHELEHATDRRLPKENSRKRKKKQISKIFHVNEWLALLQPAIVSEVGCVRRLAHTMRWLISAVIWARLCIISSLW